MRRKDREITDRSELEAILSKAQVCRLAFCDGSIPYIVPVNFGYRDGSIYLHSAVQGKKIDIIKENNNVCFEVDECLDIVKSDLACGWTAWYESVIGVGKAYILDDPEDKRNGLDVIMEKYSGLKGHVYSETSLSRVVVIRIDIEEMTGKKSGER